MPIIRDAEIWFARLDPNRPNKAFNTENPTWELQIRTPDRDVRKEWEEMGLPVKAVVPDDGQPYFRVNLRKRSIKANKEHADPVEVVDGKLQPVDPKTIGHGSIGNVRVYQYERADGKGVTNVLMAVQLTKHVVYTPKPRDSGFEETDTEVIVPETDEDVDA